MKRAVQGSNEIIVNAKPEPIWLVLEDSTLLPKWAPMVRRTTGTTERVGSLRTCRVEWQGREDEVVERCVEATPHTRIGWMMERGMMMKMFSKVSFGFALEPRDGNTTLLRMEYCYEPKNVLAGLMFEVMMRRKLNAMREMLLGNLKAFIEQSESRAVGP